MCFEKLFEIFASALGILVLCLIGSTVVFSLIGVGVGVFAGLVALIALGLMNPMIWILLGLLVGGFLLLDNKI